MAGRSACSARQFVASIDGSKEEAPDGGKLTREIATKSLDVWNGTGLRKPAKGGLYSRAPEKRAGETCRRKARIMKPISQLSAVVFWIVLLFTFVG